MLLIDLINSPKKLYTLGRIILQMTRIISSERGGTPTDTYIEHLDLWSELVSWSFFSVTSLEKYDTSYRNGVANAPIINTNYASCSWIPSVDHPFQMDDHNIIFFFFWDLGLDTVSWWLLTPVLRIFFYIFLTRSSKILTFCPVFAAYTDVLWQIQQICWRRQNLQMFVTLHSLEFIMSVAETL